MRRITRQAALGLIALLVLTACERSAPTLPVTPVAGDATLIPPLASVSPPAPPVGQALTLVPNGTPAGVPSAAPTNLPPSTPTPTQSQPPAKATAAASPPSTPASVRTVRYVVKAGDRLYRIGLRYGVSWTTIARFNGITNPISIQPGTVLLIPLP